MTKQATGTAPRAGERRSSSRPSAGSLPDRALGLLRELAAELADARLDGERAARLVAQCAEMEHLATAARGFAAREIARSREWARAGDATPAKWLAAVSGTSVADAVGLLDTVRALDDCPATAEAFVDGALSARQAEEIVSAVRADPGAEAQLLEVAATAGVAELREEARRVREAATAEEEQAARHERIRRGRFHRRSIDRDGAAVGSYRTTVDQAAALWALLDQREAGLRDAVRAAGGDVSLREQLAADARFGLGELVDADRAPGTRVLVRVDGTALERGGTEPGETCEIAGLGPIPVGRARELVGDGVLDVLVTRGVELVSVAHAGRHVPTIVDTALTWTYPTCAAAGCQVGVDLERDHVVPHADGGETSLANLARLCADHHHARHHRGWSWRRGPDARWTLHPPSG